jgi:hypothetical protein
VLGGLITAFAVQAIAVLAIDSYGAHHIRVRCADPSQRVETSLNLLTGERTLKCAKRVSIRPH